MDEEREGPIDGKERRRQEIKKLRRERYQKAKEEFKNSEYGKSLKEKQKELRRATYQQAKQRRDEKRKRGEKAEDLPSEELLAAKPRLLEAPSRDEKDQKLWQHLQKASRLPRAKLSLVKGGSEGKD